MFIVPCAAAMTFKAPYRALVIHCDVSTFPATTAAGKLGFNRQASGIFSLIGFRQPAFNGMFFAIKERKT